MLDFRLSADPEDFLLARDGAEHGHAQENGENGCGRHVGFYLVRMENLLRCGLPGPSEVTVFWSWLYTLVLDRKSDPGSSLFSGSVEG